MSIIGNLNMPVKSTGGNNTPINFGHIPEGNYEAVITRVFPWKSVKKDTTMFARDENFKLIKDADGNTINVTVKDAEWFTSDVIFTIKGGEYDGISAKLFLSTHPNFHSSKMQFLVRTNLYGVLTETGTLALDLLPKKAVGTTAVVNIRNKDIEVMNKDLGEKETKTISYVSYVVDPKDVATPTSSDDSGEIAGM